jgi:hypothetical protein
MSPSEAPGLTTELAQEVRRTLAAVDAAVASPAGADIAPDTVRDLVTAAIRLFYMRAADQRGFAPGPEIVSPSEALTLVSALLGEHDISTFDLALWLSRTGQQ